MTSRLKGLAAGRYRVLKLWDAAEEFLQVAFRADAPAGLPPKGLGTSAVPSSASASRHGVKPHAPGGTLATAYRRALEVYEQPLTQHMYITGPAMCPTLNKKGAKDPAASERLVVRLLRRPSTRSVLVGDVVAFHSPLAQPDDDTHVMVRRVAAVEGMEMVSSAPGEPPFFIPMGHCWVLADNSNLRPEDGEVIDSRSYGHIPFTNVIGRVIYAAASRTDHGPVRNNPESDEWDGAVVEAEVDVEAMFREGGDSDGEGGEEEVEQDDWTDEHGEGAQGGQQAKGGDAKGQEKKAGNSHKKP